MRHELLDRAAALLFGGTCYTAIGIGYYTHDLWFVVTGFVTILVQSSIVEFIRPKYVSSPSSDKVDEKLVEMRSQLDAVSLRMGLTK